MATDDPANGSATDPNAARDPRLDIPEVLRRPVEPSNYDPVYGDRAGRGSGKRGPRAGPGDFASVGKAWGVAGNFVFTIIAGALVGWLIDRWRGSLPVATLIGLGLGFATAFIRIIRQTQREEREEQARRRRNP